MAEDRLPMLFLAFVLWFCTAPLAILLLREILSPGLTVNLALAYLGLLILGCLILCRRNPSHCDRGAGGR